MGIAFKKFLLPLLLPFLLTSNGWCNLPIYPLPLVFKGEQIPNLIGEKPENISLWSFSKGKFQTIPLQIDQVDDKGWVSFNPKRKTPGIQKMDQILWKKEDMGQKAPKNAFPHLFEKLDSKGILLETEIIHKKNSSWVYFLISPTPFNPKVESSIQYFPEDDFIITPRYYLGFQKVILANRFGWMQKDRNLGPNLLNRVSVHFRGKVFLGLFPVKLTEENLQNERIAYKKGPVRVIKRTQSTPRLPLGFKGPASITDYFCSENAYQVKARIHFLPGSKSLLKDAFFKIYVDISAQKEMVTITLPLVEPFPIQKNLQPNTYPLGKMPPELIHFGNKSNPHRFLVHLNIPKEAQDVLRPNLLVYVHEPKDYPPQWGTLSFLVQLVPDKKDVEFNLNLYSYFLDQKTMQPQKLMDAVLDSLQSPFTIEKIREFQPQTNI